MSQSSDNHLHLACPQCQKQLKVPSHLLGKRVKCPSCGHAVKVMGMVPRKVEDDDWLNLDTPAIQIESVKPAESPSSPQPHGKKVTTGPVAMPKLSDPTHRAAMPHGNHSATSPSESKPRLQKTAPSPLQDEKAQSPTTSQPPSDAGSKVPPPSSFDVEDDDFPALAPEEPRNVPKWTIDLDGLESEIDKQKVSKKPAESKRPTAAPSRNVRSSDNAKKDTKNAEPLVTAFDEVEFRVACKVCGTLTYVFESQVGTKLQCEDCQSTFVVPPPPPGFQRAKSRKRSEINEKAESEFELKKVEEPKVAKKSFEEMSAADVLQRAEQEAEESSDEDMQTVYDFDSRGWLLRTFSFLQDPGLMGIAFGTGLLLALLLVVSNYFASMANQTGGVSLLLRVLVLAAGGVPLLSVTLANGLAILQSAANRMKRVREWPVLNPGDWFEETLFVGWAFTLAILPGTVLGAVFQNAGHNVYLTTALMVGSVWLLFPLFLLSMLDNQSLFQPVSFDVFGSLKKKLDSWGGFYMVSGIGSFILFLLLAFALSIQGIVSILAGFVVPLFLFFLFHQMGILAAAISDVTELHFEEEEK